MTATAILESLPSPEKIVSALMENRRQAAVLKSLLRTSKQNTQSRERLERNLEEAAR